MMQSSTTLSCKRDGCTLSETGMCMFNNVPEQCPERLAHFEGGESSTLIHANTSGPVLDAPPEAAKFSSSFTVSLRHASEMWRLRDCKTVGILGVPNTGKTAFLVSLYLLLSGKRLEKLEFRNSKTLMAFEEISRGARKWRDGAPPDDMTMHTEIKDERTAGFLHLKLFSKSHNRTLQLLFPDFPGEWTNSLITNNRVDRLSFFKHASAIWIMTNGQDLANSKTRMNAIYRIEVLIDRILEFIGADIPKIHIVVTHFDQSGPIQDRLSDLMETYKSRNVCIDVSETAAFADLNTEILPGHGIEDLILSLFQVTPSRPLDFWPSTPSITNSRSFLNIQPT